MPSWLNYEFKREPLPFSLSISLHGHLLMKGHAVGKSLIAVASDVADAGGTVAVEEAAEKLTDEVIVYFALAYIYGTLGAGSETFRKAALADTALEKPRTIHEARLNRRTEYEKSWKS